MPAPQDYTQDFGQYVEDNLVALGRPPFGQMPPPPPPPPPPPAFEPDPFVLAQIEREKTRRGEPKERFDILINDHDRNLRLWTAPYLVDLGNGFGWISGDRAGYKAAYMFLVSLDGPEKGMVVGRVFFRSISGASSYIIINDKYMNEIQTTGIGYDGKEADPKSQAQSPAITEPYEPDNGPEVRPLVKYVTDGEVIEDRSYTNTETPVTDIIRFGDAGLITEPFTDNNGLGNAPHTVYQRARVLARVEKDGVFNPAVGVYYDVLHPSFQITR